MLDRDHKVNLVLVPTRKGIESKLEKISLSLNKSVALLHFECCV